MKVQLACDRCGSNEIIQFASLMLYPTDDALFVDVDMLEWDPDFFFCVDCEHEGRWYEG